MMIDADHFKNVNDIYGHPAGDTVLEELALRIQQGVRSYDLAGRYGGEVFLAVLPGCSGQELLASAERIRTAIAARPVQADDVLLAVTVSIGVAILDPLLDGSEKQALAAADSALYNAKHSGRNCVRSAVTQLNKTAK